MGRYYRGDINGKFWFAIQDSDDADFFGSKGEPPNTLEYYFDAEEHKESIISGIEFCVMQLGDPGIQRTDKSRYLTLPISLYIPYSHTPHTSHHAH